MALIKFAHCLKCGKQLNKWAKYKHNRYCLLCSFTKKRRKFYSNLIKKNKPHLGKKHSEEAKKVMSIKRKKYFETHDNYWKGKKLSKRVRKIMSENAKKRIGKLNPFYGKTHTLETRELIRKSRKLYLGEKSSNWKGGISPLNIMIRSMEENRNLIKNALKRDSYICETCKKEHSGKMEGHHKKAFSLILLEFLNQYSQFSPIEDKETLVRLATAYEPFWDINNIKTLCKKCHKLEHRSLEKICS